MTMHPARGEECRKAWAAIAAREYRDWRGVPAACTYSAFERTFARWAEEHGTGCLGSGCRAASYRMHVVANHERNLKVWFRRDRIALIEIKYPILAYSARELIEALGAPATKLDYHLDVILIPCGAWVYPARGITIFLDVDLSSVMGLALFHPCDVAEYLDDLHPDERLWEYPMEE